MYLRRMHFQKKLLLCTLFLTMVFGAMAQKKGMASICPDELKVHMEFLASDELKGRDTGEEGLEVAARYLAVQAGHMSLLQAPGSDAYLQPYTIRERSYDRDRSRVKVITSDSSGVIIPEAFHVFPPPSGDEFHLEGEVVFAGYGIHAPDQGYDDFEGIDMDGKVVLIMTRAPLNKDGTRTLFEDDKWNNAMSIRHKIPSILQRGATAILVVYDPKSGASSFEEAMPGMARHLSRSRFLKDVPEEAPRRVEGRRAVMVHRSVADRLLEQKGTTLEELQQQIDSSMEAHSFVIENTRIDISLYMKHEDMVVSNIFGYIEGADPDLKDEMLLYMAHYDHIGTTEEGEVYNGADDNASGTIALLEIAEAFLAEKQQPARSIGFLWVSAEEIGLFGSKYYAAHPLIPLERTIGVVNLDMVGRSKTAEDERSGRRELTIMGGDSVKVIGGLQSKVLMEINEQSLKEMGMTGDYSFNTPDHPQRYFYRSDHISLAKKDIPVIFYSTGTHRDYHRVTDVTGKIDYEKFVKMTRLSYLLGHKVSAYPGSITVDNPMSLW